MRMGTNMKADSSLTNLYSKLIKKTHWNYAMLTLFVIKIQYSMGLIEVIKLIILTSNN